MERRAVDDSSFPKKVCRDKEDCATDQGCQGAVGQSVIELVQHLLPHSYFLMSVDLSRNISSFRVHLSWPWYYYT